MKKNFVNEWMSVSDEVNQISKMIANRIVDSVDKLKPQRQLGYYNSTPFVNGSFVLKTNSVIGDINVVFMAYLCNDEQDYRFVLSSGDLNCGADNDTNTVIVNTAFIGNRTEENFVGNIAHEVNHLYQYANGMSKNVNLYDNVINVLQNPNIHPNEKSPVYLIYHTFKHEVDSFATQFYHMLINNNETIGFAEAKKKFTPYYNVMKSYEVANQLDISTLTQCVKRTGLTLKQWRHRVDSGMKRLEDKLRSVYHRYCIEKARENKPIEGIIRRQLFLLEQYDLINEEFEPIYTINE